MGIDNVDALRNMGEYEENIPDDVADMMVKNNYTRAQAEDILARRKKFEAELSKKSDNEDS